MYDVIQCSVVMVATLTSYAAEAMSAQVVHFCPTVVAGVGMAECGAQAQANRDPNCVVVHSQAKRSDGQGIQPIP